MSNTSESRPVIHVVEDDASMRTAVMRLLRYAGFDAQAYSSAGEFLLTDRGDAPGCILLDVGLPGLSGMELQAALARNNDRAPVVFLTGRGDIAMSVRAMKAGAVDFLTKPVKREALLAAVNEALAQDANDRSRHEQINGLHERLRSLTLREREVFARVIQGRLNKQIADELGTSIRTVKHHRARVMEKMNARTLADLVRISDELGGIAAVEPSSAPSRALGTH